MLKTLCFNLVKQHREITDDRKWHGVTGVAYLQMYRERNWTKTHSIGDLPIFIRMYQVSTYNIKFNQIFCKK
jgi:hypothetical protein